MPNTELNIIVCVDHRDCRRQRFQGHSGAEMLQQLQALVEEQHLEERVQVTPCYCIFGCTYGPRIDVAKRWSGEKRVYGCVEGEASITRRGRVRFSQIPEDLTNLITDNLPQK